MISIFEAVKIIRREAFSLATELIDLEKSINRILAEKISADTDLPPFNRSQMDGFAARAEDVNAASQENPVKLKIVGESIAGKGFGGKIKTGEAVRIMTGAPIPDGSDAVQKKESAREIFSEAGETLVEILAAAKPNQNIVKLGAETKKGDKIFSKGEIVTAKMIAPLAAFGYARVEVFKRPRAMILATGSEIVEPHQKPKRDQIRNSNSATLKILAEQSGAKAKILPLVRDEIENLKQTIVDAAKTCDVLIISGGVSVGDYDFTKPALREIGAEIFFEKVSLRPGKPTVFAKLNDTLIFGLPGNPVSVAVTFYLFVRTALLTMQSAKNCELKEGFAVAAEKIKAAKERDSFLPVFIEANADGKLVIESLRFSGSSNFIAFARANALVFVSQNTDVEKGAAARIVYLPD